EPRPLPGLRRRQLAPGRRAPGGALPRVRLLRPRAPRVAPRRHGLVRGRHPLLRARRPWHRGRRGGAPRQRAPAARPAARRGRAARDRGRRGVRRRRLRRRGTTPRLAVSGDRRHPRGARAHRGAGRGARLRLAHRRVGRRGGAGGRGDLLRTRAHAEPRARDGRRVGDPPPRGAADGGGLGRDERRRTPPRRLLAADGAAGRALPVQPVHAPPPAREHRLRPRHRAADRAARDAAPRRACAHHPPPEGEGVAVGARAPHPARQPRAFLWAWRPAERDRAQAAATPV
ncbi:MAG: hypothetical protein AVDCRST_MAG40-2254, partial [uncultured Gemmatimonadaceae bacterium]